MVGKQINISIYAPVNLCKASGWIWGSGKFVTFSEATVKFPTLRHLVNVIPLP